MTRVMTFRAGRSRFAVPVSQVAEVIESTAVAPSPGRRGGEKLVGLARVHDRWIPVLDVEVEGSSPDGPESLVVLGRGRQRIALRVQEPGQVLDLGAQARPLSRDEDALLELGGQLIRYVDLDTLVPDFGALLSEGKDEMSAERTRSEPIQVVAFRIGPEEFGLDVMRTFEVLRPPEVHSLPNAPDFVEGLAEVRAGVVPVIDMRKRFGLSPTEDTSTRMLVATIGESRVGLLVDDVPGVVEISPDAVSPAPDFFKGLAGRFLEGVASEGERLVILLDVDEILTSKERIALETVIEAAAPEEHDEGDGEAEPAEEGSGGTRHRGPKKRGK